MVAPTSSPIALATRRDTTRLAAAIGRALVPGDLALLCGGVGAGKTFLVRALLRAAGVRTPVVSPTFVLVQEYLAGQRSFVHVDLYRLRESRTPLPDEVARLGLRERREEGAILLVEWGEDLGLVVGGPAELTVTLSVAGPTARSVALSGVRCGDIV